MCVARDEDTEDGGKKGQLTSNPSDIDAVVRRAWNTVYNGIGGCIGTAVDLFLNKYAKYIMKVAPCDIPDITGDRVYAAFAATK